MIFNCAHGYFIIREVSAGDVSRFMSLFEGFSFASKGDFFTFEALKDAPDFALQGGDFLGCPTTKNFEGSPADVMRSNKIVFDFSTDKVVPISTITKRAELVSGANYFLSTGLILPGSITDGGLRVTDYAARYLFDKGLFRYSEVTLV